MKHSFLNYTQKSAVYLVEASSGPLFVTISLFFLLSGTVGYFHSCIGGREFLVLGLVGLVVSLAGWWKDVRKEALFSFLNTKTERSNYHLSFVLFILSEVMFFFGFFWAFFHSSLSPDFELGGIWPPVGITPFSPWGLPLLNTFILVTSGATLTLVHCLFRRNSAFEAPTAKNADENIFVWTVLTLVLALIFTSLQHTEYLHAPFSINSGVFGTIFFVSTGFHGLHVIVGTILIAVFLFRFYLNDFARGHAVLFELASWYWHFVDVVWILLFICIYWWGGK